MNARSVIIKAPVIGAMGSIILIVLGLPIRMPLTNSQTLFLGLAFLVSAFTLSSLAYKLTKEIVTKHGVDKEQNVWFRESLIRGTGVRDHLLMWAAILGFMSFMYFFAGSNIWVILTVGVFGTMFLDCLNDYLVHKKHSEPTQPNLSPSSDQKSSPDHPR